MRRSALLSLVAALLLAGPAAAARIEGPYGSGAAQVWLVRPSGRPRSIVVFGHGWKFAPPSASDPFVREFEPWLDHLAANGSAVIFPRYQLGGNSTDGPGLIDAYRLGVRRAFARLDRSLPVVVVGYSFGATLGAYYAADARRWGLPQPRALDEVFPAGLIPGIAPAALDPAVSVLVQVGDSDTVAGAGGAAPILAWLHGHARLRHELVRSHGSFVAAHPAPKGTTAAARAAFWAPLDALIAASR